ncbi:FG-GAP-like repeat-containing protein [Tautonia plasticadhaerens]|uniref:ASPIC and UnbV n=1 Tax=Tautonia plasticadhaerens TaxID=2527974 RepID=A0A518HD37_9BACT|nr:FG-GAP-like repeat-containing protein [Tautonia plasticadhaerens]QDV38777.1 ASPIC and UnbV [Tautonia plasticadhaerens]
MAVGGNGAGHRARRLGGALSGAAALAALAIWALRPSDAQRWSAIEAAASARRWDEAAPRLSRWVERHPDDSRARVMLGASLLSLGREDEADDVLRVIPEGDPAWPRALGLRAALAMGRSDRLGAEQALRAAIDADPTAVEPRARLLGLMFRLRREEEARGLLRDLLRLTGDPRHLVSLTGLELEHRQPEQFRDLGDEGDRLLRQLRPFLERSPRDPWLVRARGLIRYERGDPAGALPDLVAASLATADDPALRLALAGCKAALGRPEEVERALGPLPEQSAEQARWWLLLGEAEQALGRPEQALDRWRSAVKADPQHLQAHYTLGRALARAGLDEEAAPVLGRAEVIRGRTEALKAAVNDSLSGVDDAGQCLAIARLCLDSDLPALARSWFQQAARLDPFDREAQSALARLGTGGPDPEPITPPRLTAEVVDVSAPGPSAAAPPPAPSVARFEDQAESRGLAFRYDSGATDDLFIADTMGGGVGLIDFDGDGRLDVYLVNGCPLPVDHHDPPAPNRLFRNQGDGTFADVTESAGVGGRGYGMGCAVGDIDADGDEDLFVSGFGSTVLYRNEGDGTFTDVTEAAGVRSDRWSTAAGFADLDGDGDLDLVVVTYVEADPGTAPPCTDSSGRPIHCPPGRFPAQADLLFRNDGDGTFTDVSAESGIEVPDGRGLGLAIADLDGDGRLDLFVANDAVPDFLFLNRGGLRFEEVGVAAGAAFDGAGRATASMGVVADDLDGDGLIDLYHTNFRNEPDTLLRNLGGGQFADATPGSGLEAPSLAVTGFGASAFDGDNDGILDLFVANGHVDDQPWIEAPMAQPPRWYAGLGGGRYATAPAGTAGAYFDRRVVGRGSASGDLDGDGLVDLVVDHRDSPASLLRNVTPGPGHWLGVRLIGSASGPTPVGARVSCRAGGRTIARWQTAGTGYLSAPDRRLWFGLGDAGEVDELEIRWPSGAVERHTGLAADRVVEFREAGGPTSGP